MGDTVTQCPNCKTSFRVSQEQLEIADGRVRCGECMHVFAALDHVLAPSHSAPAPAPSPPAPPAVSPAVPPSSSPISIFPPDEDSEPDPWHGVSEESVEAVQAELQQEPEEPEDLDFGENDFGDDELSDFEPGNVEAGDGEPGDVKIEPEQLDDETLEDDDLLFDDLGPRREKDVVAEELLRKEALENSEFDESFFDSLNEAELEEDDETRLALPPLTPQGERDDTDRTLWNEAPSPPRARDQDSDTRWALEMIDDLHRDQNADVHVARSVADDFSLDDATRLDSFNVSGNIDRQFDNLGGFADDYGQSDSDDTSDFDRARRGGWLWALGSLLLLLILAAQYVVFNFHTLATDDRFRPVLERACATLACELPVLEDLKKISSEKLVVRSHPDKSDALMIDVIITNRAKFAQPFPALELTFSDLRGKVIATHSFYPSEYLHGELSGMTLMPSRNPIHLELDINDPGSAAINYKLKLVKGYD